MVVLPPELVEEIVTCVPYDCLLLLKNLESDVWNATVDEHLEKRRTIRFFFCHSMVSINDASDREIFYAEQRLKNPTDTLPFDRTALFHSSMKRFTSLEAFVCSVVNNRRGYAERCRRYHLSAATEGDLLLAFRCFPVCSQLVWAPALQRFSAVHINQYFPLLSRELWVNVPNTFQFVHLALRVPQKQYSVNYVDDFVERVRQSGRNVIMYMNLYDDPANHFSPQLRRSLVDLFLQPQFESLAINTCDRNHHFELEDFQRISEFWSTNDGYACKVLVVPVRPEHIASIALLFENGGFANMKCRVTVRERDRPIRFTVSKTFVLLELFKEGRQPSAEQRFDEDYWTMSHKHFYDVSLE